MELGAVRKFRYLLLAVLCITMTLTITYFNPEMVPHRVRQLTNDLHSSLSNTNNLQPRPKSIHPKPWYEFGLTSVQETNVKPIRVVETANTSRLTVVKYNDYPSLKEIECVNLRTAQHGANICIHPLKKDLFVSGSLKRGGTWEQGIVDSVKTRLEKCPDCQFIDIGANLGVFTISIASMGRKVIAVEPLNDNLLRLTKAIKLNSMQQTVTTIANAVSDVYENVTFWQPKDNAGGTHTASLGVKTFDRKIFNAAKGLVSTIKLDDLLDVIQFKKAVMKIDIEGYEPRAFKAAAKLFEAVEIHYVFMEWGGKANDDKNYVQPMLDFFSSRGFKPHNNDLRPLNAANYELTFDRTKGWPFDIVWIRP